MNLKDLERPKLPKLELGQEMTLVEQVWGRRAADRRTLVTVTKIGRKYVHLSSSEFQRTWVMVIETQRAPSDYGQSTRFTTAEQLAYDERVTAARDALREAGVEITRFGQVHAHGTAGVLQLAAFVTEHFPRVPR